MALIGKGLAIMSLGMSCQTARQIRNHHALLQELAGEELADVSTPFDWTICGPGDVAGMLQDGRTYPAAVGELHQRHKPYWPARRCWLWHAKGAVVDFDGYTRKAQELAAALDLVRAARRRVFFLSNTQNNLHQQRRAVGGFDIEFRRADLEALALAVQDHLGGGAIHVVTHKGQAARVSGITRNEVARDRSSWEGSRAIWESVFRGAIRRR